MAGGRNVVDRGMLSGVLTLLLGLLAMGGFAEPSDATVATADGEGAYCVVWCVDPAGIRWDEALVD
jgi:hypothetical protein